jgi:L,D-transpeptidase catalytic domain
MVGRVREGLIAIALLLGSAPLGCSHKGAAAATIDARPEALAPEAGEIVKVAPSDSGADAAPSLRVIATEGITPIFNRPEWAPHDPTKASDERMGVVRLGYLRKGDNVDAQLTVLKNSHCSEGWYELVAGGFVCGKSLTRDPNAPELADAPHLPLTDGPLPYEYGLNLTTGTPLYWRKPKSDERARYERGLPVGKAPPSDLGGGSGDSPWYLKEGARKQVSLNELTKQEGPVAKRMVRGFYLSVDKKVKFSSGYFYRTPQGLLAPVDHVMLHESKTEFEGVHVGDADEKRKLPIAFVVGFHARQYRFTDGVDKPKRGDHVDRFAVLGLTGQKKMFEERTYYETLDGWWTRDLDVTTTKPGPPPSDLAPGEKWVDVNLSTQSLVAFEGDKAVYATFISSGRHDDHDPAKDHRTKMGTFRIREKHISATMDDDSASDGPYSIEDVPWIMYFNGSYALHGAFWHSAFGHERSHGCVNMTPHDAKEIFGWAGPTLPAGWHGVRATADNPGTRVIVHD